jgi:hypothetical protein
MPKNDTTQLLKEMNAKDSKFERVVVGCDEMCANEAGNNAALEVSSQDPNSTDSVKTQYRLAALLQECTAAVALSRLILDSHWL